MKINNDDILIKNKYCDNKLKEKGLSEFKRINDYSSYDGELHLRHIKCNKVIKTTLSNFLKRKNKCPNCNKPFRKKLGVNNEYYQRKLDNLYNKEFELVSDYYSNSKYVKLKHRICGHIFEVRPDNFETRKHKCQNCSDIKLINNNASLVKKKNNIESLYNYEYEILDKYFNHTSCVKVKHKYCDTIFDISVATLKKYNHSIHCPTCKIEDREDKFLNRLDELYKGEFMIMGWKYKGFSTPVRFKHIKCGGSFKSTPLNMLKTKKEYCPNCEQKYKNDKFSLELLNRYKGEYELVDDYKTLSKEVEIKHLKCNKTFFVLPRNIIGANKNKKCPHCEQEQKNKDYSKKLNKKHNGEYRLVGDFKKTDEQVEIKHVKCNNTFFISSKYAISKYKNMKCPCCKPDSKNEEFKRKLNEQYNSEFELLDKYTSSYDKVKIKHSKCGHIFDTLPKHIVGKGINKKCPYCEQEQKNKEFKKKLDIKYNGKFELVGDYEKHNKKVEIKHLDCNQIFKVLPRCLIDKKANKKCPYCNESKNKRK